MFTTPTILILQENSSGKHKILNLVSLADIPTTQLTNFSFAKPVINSKHCNIASDSDLLVHVQLTNDGSHHLSVRDSLKHMQDSEGAVRGLTLSA